MKRKNTWNVKRLVDDSFVSSAHRTSISYSILTDFTCSLGRCGCDWLFNRSGSLVNKLQVTFIKKSLVLTKKKGFEIFQGFHISWETYTRYFPTFQFNVNYRQSAFYNYILPWTLPLAQVSITGSIYFTMAITVERYVCVCWPFYR